MSIGTVTATWRYPVKSLQGVADVDLEVSEAGIAGDRAWGIADAETGALLSAKRVSALLEAGADDDRITLPDGSTVEPGDAGADAALSAWLGRPVELVRAGERDGIAYEMTFDPPDDDAEVFAIPAPPGTLVDLAHVHLLSATTLAALAEQRPDLDWDVRRFRPNVLVDVHDPEPFAEDAWAGRQVAIGSALLHVLMPTVRCAMPLRAQPGGIARQPELFGALTDLHEAHPNHLGLYLAVVEPGTIRVGDAVELR